MVMEIVHEDMGEEDNMQCMNHPQKNITPGGICAFCLQEKLGKLVSSSFPAPIFPSTSPPSSSPPFRSEFSSTAATSGGAALQIHQRADSLNTGSDSINNGYCSKKSKLPFVLTHKKKKKKDGVTMGSSSSDSTAIVFKRSKSTANPSQRGMSFLNENPDGRRFWSFLYLSKYPTCKKNEKLSKDLSFRTNNSVGSSSVNEIKSKERTREDFVVVEENGSPEEAAFERKVSRSKSVGCGSRSFSGDFFERISTGFGDCTLRRVESQREGKAKVQSRNAQDCIKERVRCGGIFSGLMIASSSSSSSSSSSNWVSEDKVNSARHSSMANSNLSHVRSKSWGWVLASPMRAFSKPNRKRDVNPKTTNLSAIPSLLAVSG